MATIVASAAGGNWNATGTWVGGVVPTAADDVQLDATSGNVTINAAAACRSLDCNGYTNTLTHNTSITLSIGTSTPGTSNIALRLVAGMTYTRASVTSSAINFVSTSGTQQTITTGGKTLSNWTVNGAGSSYLLADDNTTSSTATVTLTNGTLNTGGQTCTWGNFNSLNSNTRALTLGASSINIVSSTATTAWNVSATNMTLTVGSSTITFSGNGSGMTTGGLTYNNVIFTGSGTRALTGSCTIANFTHTGVVGSKTDFLTLGGNFNVPGTFSVNGGSAVDRILINSSSLGLTRSVQTGTVSCSNVDFMDFTGGGAASWDLSAIPGGSGDAGGNSSITFTPSVTQTWSGTSGGNWSTNAWTTRMPLPQDDVIIDAAFTAGQIVVMDTPRAGRSIDWSAATGSPTWNIATLGGSSMMIFGSLTLNSNMSISGTSTFSPRGRSSFTITSAGRTMTTAFNISAPNGTYTLQDDFSVALGFTAAFGTFDANGHNVTASTFTSNATNTRSVLMGSGTWALNSTTGTVWNLTNTGNTFNGGTATIVINTASASTRTFVGAGFTYGTLNYTIAGSTGALVLNDNNTFANINFTDGSNTRTLTLPSGGTTTVTGSFNVRGTLGNLMTLNSTTATSTATISKTSGVVSNDFMSIRDSTATGGATFYAGSHSTSVSNNSGWLFADAPLSTASNFLIFNG